MEEPVAEIKIHAEMKLDTMRITQYKKAAKIQKSETQKDGQITILLAEPLQPGRAEIAASFTAMMQFKVLGWTLNCIRGSVPPETL